MIKIFDWYGFIRYLMSIDDDIYSENGLYQTIIILHDKYFSAITNAKNKNIKPVTILQTRASQTVGREPVWGRKM